MAHARPWQAQDDAHRRSPADLAAAPSRADAGGFQTLTTYQNQGLNAYDRVQIEGQKLCALRGD